MAYEIPKRRRKMRKFEIHEISGVDRPAQEGARVVIMKRDDSAPARAPASATVAWTSGNTTTFTLNVNGTTVSFAPPAPSPPTVAKQDPPPAADHDPEKCDEEDCPHCKEKARMDSEKGCDPGHEEKSAQVEKKDEPVSVAKEMLRPGEDETEKEFVSRFMADEGMRSEFPDDEQRAAVAHARYRESLKRMFEFAPAPAEGVVQIVPDAPPSGPTGDVWGELPNPATRPHPTGAGVAMTTTQNGHHHTLDTSMPGGATSMVLTPGDDVPHDHPWVRTHGGQVIIGQNSGHGHELLQP